MCFKAKAVKKILATLGPTSLNEKIIKQMDEAGVDMFRVNMTHTSVDMLKIYIRMIQAATEKPICIDSEGSLKRSRVDSFSERDIKACEIGQKMGITNYALSFTNSAKDVWDYRKMLFHEDNLISKIETKEGIKNLQKILTSSDEILIDRGDLSREVDLINVPTQQIKIINLAKKEKVPVYVATNFLESMTSSYKPNIAEVNDAAATLLMGASGLVLAAETAIGKYPVETVKFVKELIDHYGI